MSVAELHIRIATLDDAGALCALLNEVIQIGGSTAYETVMDAEKFASIFLLRPAHICCHAAQLANGALVGFQFLEYSHEIGGEWASISTFARANNVANNTPPVKGVGRALFPFSRDFLINTPTQFIDATIRADNNSGLAYYEKMGFRTYKTTKNKPLKDGTLVDRISKQFTLPTEHKAH